MILLHKLFIANFTLKASLRVMDQAVLFQTSLLGERLVAYIALEGLFLGVDFHVDVSPSSI